MLSSIREVIYHNALFRLPFVHFLWFIWISLAAKHIKHNKRFKIALINVLYIFIRHCSFHKFEIRLVAFIGSDAVWYITNMFIKINCCQVPNSRAAKGLRVDNCNPCDMQLRRIPLQWRHNERNGDSNHQPHDCLFNGLFRHRSKKTSKLRVTGLCEGNSPVTGEFPAQGASNADNVSIWWRHHEYIL